MPESALNAIWVPVKLRLEGGRDSLTEREWATLISLLTIWVEAEHIKLERRALSERELSSEAASAKIWPSRSESDGGVERVSER